MNMILADKIINERKKNGWSQEELAEKLGVSRQSVSKWEGALATPDLQKLINMAELFGVSTDYLLKDDFEPTDIAESPINEYSDNIPPLRKVTMEEANQFIEDRKKAAPHIANGVTLCILSPVIMFILLGLCTDGLIGISEDAASALGVVSLLIIVAIAVFVFISRGSGLKKYEFFEKEEIDTEYGVDGMVKARMEAYEETNNRMNGIGVICCIISAIPLLIVSVLGISEGLMVEMVAVLLVIVSVGVNVLVRTGMVKGSFDALLQLGSYAVTEKRANKKFAGFSGAYWCIVTGIYLLISFLTNAWHITWVVWPVCALIFAGIMAALKSKISEQ